MKVIELNASVTDSNDRDADQLRQDTKDQGTLIVNIMSSPGSGKTTLLSRVITDMKEKISIGVMEADIASDVDAIKIQNLGAESIQAHTDGMCHMDAGMTRRALEAMDNNRNVGNLICPAEFDTGAGKDVMILSIPEGDDKPLKYPLMFSTSHALVITKVDALPYFDFDMDKCVCRVKRLNPDIKIFPVSAKTGEGMEAFENWLFEAQAEWKNESLIQ